MTDQSIEEMGGWLKPSIGETYILLLNEIPNPSVYIVSEINESDNVVIMNNISDKNDNLLLELDNDKLVLSSTNSNCT